MDVVWLKRDLRIHDHGPFAEIIKSNNPFCILYLFEPDQLSEPTVHGSHISFINESLVDLDRTLSGIIRNDNRENHMDDDDDIGNYSFQCITVCHANAVYTMNSIHHKTKINRILSHQETGHYKSFIRDKTIRKWCRINNVPIIEYNQTGVTRCLRDRDDFAKKFNDFLMKPLYSDDIPFDIVVSSNHDQPTTRNGIVYACKNRLVTTLDLHKRIRQPIKLEDVTEIPIEHRTDRIQRQKGGETKALKTLQSFLSSRGSFYSSGISSPNTSWNSGSRLSPYLTWGNISIRLVIHKTREKQCYLRQEKKKLKGDKKLTETDCDNSQKQQANIDTPFSLCQPNRNNSDAISSTTVDGYWLKSLQAFSSRMHWRSHFIQKLESEPLMEKRDLCPAYQHLRRQEDDWNQSYYDAWATGKTGFPFLDACMRCLIKHGWLNFRMRAMVVSFATYNLWLDWKRIAPHLARLFLDYEPGIHYPQLQMQSGTTGINAMRVYNVTKQGKDQDPKGIFIRKYIHELKNVPLEYIHEPSRMTRSVQEKTHVYIVNHGNDDYNNSSSSSQASSNQECFYYPKPIVNEQETAKIAKDKVSSIRKQESTKKMAEEVYIKHGSRNKNMNNKRQRGVDLNYKTDMKLDNEMKDDNVDADSSPSREMKKSKHFHGQKNIKDLFSRNVTNELKQKEKQEVAWPCKTCTFLNDKPFGLACSMCGTLR